jgi:hypothetical protein
MFLNRRTRHGAERAEDATITALRFQHHRAVHALVKVDAVIGRHLFEAHMAALRTCELGLKDDVSHLLGFRRGSGVL